MVIPANKPVYFVSARPEAYEFWGEVDIDVARRMAVLIAERAGRRFPGVEFRIDETWHVHPHGMELVAAYIDDRECAWFAELTDHAKAA